MNLPPITFYYRPLPHKRARYTPDILTYAISVSSENYFSTLTTPYDFPDLLPYNDPNTLHVVNKYVPFLGGVKKYTDVGKISSEKSEVIFYYNK